MLIFCLSTMILGFSQETYLQTSEVINFNKSTGIIVLKTIGQSSNKKNTLINAEKKAFKDLLFIGVSGFNNGNSLIGNPNEIKIEFNDYFNTFFNNGRYKIFKSSSVIISEPKKIKSKTYQSLIKVTINVNALSRDLLAKEIIKEFGLGKKPKKTIQPTIMVVPYKKEGETYSRVLQQDFDKRVAIAKVQEGFDKLGFNTIDFEAKLRAVLRANDFETDSQTSLDKQLIRNSGADIYVTVDMLKNFSSSGNQVSLILKAYETSSAKALASKKGWSGKFRTNQIDRLCGFAVELIMDDFLEMLNNKFNKTTKEGSTIVLNISLLPESDFNMDSEIGADEIPLSDLLRMWVKKNAFNNYYHLQGTVTDAMIFDDIRVPLKDKNGNSYNQNDFAFDFWSYLKNELKISCKKRIDGQTIYITIK